jgi:exodeoxyribonuclease V alpha subunit
LVVDALNALKEERYVVLERLPDETGAVYLRNLHQQEVGVAKLLATILYTPKLLPLIDVTKELNSFQSEYRFDLAPEQRVAVEAVCKGGIVVITGGPGTGKTTIVKTILHLLGKKNLRVLLAAPTGRAAKRLQELTHHPASTIHRLLQYSPRDGGFLRNRRNPLRADFIVVDEASMVDITLAYHLLQAVDARTSLVFVGDVDQLPSVGPGNVLRDLIESNCLEVVQLTQIFRQAGNSLIVTNAHRINQGEMPILGSQSGKADLQFLKRETPEEVLESIKELLLETFPREHHLDPVRDVQIITPMHRGVIGAQNLNRELQSLLNPAGVALERAGGSLRVGDKVMQIANDYDKDVYNGDTGLIVGIDREERIVKVRFDHRIVVYDFSDLDQIELAYAVTVHKSQGSEYPAVIIPIHFTHAIMLQRNLLYTAVTRGRKLVYILGQWGALRMAVENANLAPRYSALHLRLQSECRQKNA